MNELHKKIGDLLRIERTRQQLLLKEISEELNITVENLEALEAGDVDSLPTEMYFNLFAKTYAEYLGIHYSRTVEAIKENLADNTEGDSDTVGDNKPGPSTNRPESKQARRRWWQQWSSGTRLVGIVAAAVLLIAVVVTGKLLSTGSPTAPPKATNDDSIPLIHPSTDAQASTSTDYAGYDWNVPEPAAPSSIMLRLRAREESWATVLADGDTAIYRTLVPGREYEAEAKHRFLVSIGIASVVDIFLDGEQVNLIDSTTKRISRVEINQANLASFLSRAGTPPVNTTGDRSLTVGTETGPDRSNEIRASGSEAIDSI